jgi:tetratricopeptide (TPR) repeat protein
MNVRRKIAITTMIVLFVASVGKAQSLDDAQKAVTAEQYQKAKAMFSELVKVQPTPENYFGFGELYLTLNNPDSAKIVFEKGIKADEKSKYMMNYIGLGTVDLFNHKDDAAKVNFDKATEDMRKKDYEQYIYIGKAYTYEGSRNLDKAFGWFAKADEYGEKDPRLHIARGNAYKFQKKNSEAVAEYQRAMSLKDNLLAVQVNVGEIWTQAFNFELAESTLKGVIAKDPNFGPAYRALAENYYRWASAFPNRQAEFLGQAKTNYSKYLDLTDRSTDSRYRYLIFLFNAKDYATLEKAASDFINSPGFKKDYIVARRFRGYSAVENGNSEVGIDALNNFITNSSVENQKQDSLAILSYVKGYNLDTTNTEVLRTIASNYKNIKKYGKAADFYDKVAALSKESYQDWFYAGYMRYFSYANMVSANSTDTALMKSTLLKSDSALTYVAVKTKNLAAYLYKARVEYYLNPVNDNEKVKNAYDKVVEIISEKPQPSDAEKKYLLEAYSSIGAFYIKSDKPKAKEYFDKALVLDPNNQQVKDALAALKASKS